MHTVPWKIRALRMGSQRREKRTTPPPKDNLGFYTGVSLSRLFPGEHGFRRTVCSFTFFPVLQV